MYCLGALSIHRLKQKAVMVNSKTSSRYIWISISSLFTCVHPHNAVADLEWALQKIKNSWLLSPREVMKGSMACFSTQVLLGGMLSLESKHYSFSKRKLSQRREKERYHMGLLSWKRKFSSWVNLGRSGEPDLKAKLEGAQMHPWLCQSMLRIHHQLWWKQGTVPGLPPCHFSDHGRDTEQGHIHSCQNSTEVFHWPCFTSPPHHSSAWFALKFSTATSGLESVPTALGLTGIQRDSNSENSPIARWIF